MKNQLLTVISVIWLAACTTGSTSLTNEQIKAIKADAQKATAAYIDAIEKNDQEVIIASFHNSDKTRLIFDSESYDYEGFVELANKILSGVDHQVMDTKEELITVLSKDCFVHYWKGFNGMYFKDGTSMEMEDFFLTYVYKKIDDKWKIIHAHESWKDIPMPAPETEMMEE